MSDVYSPVEIILDAKTRTRRVDVGGLLQVPDVNQQIELDWGSQYLFTARVYKGLTTAPYVFTAGTTFLWGADNVYTASADPIVSLNAVFNIPGDASFDPAVGALCWRADLATSALKSILESTTNPSQIFHSYLWAFTPAGVTVIIAKWDMTIWMPAVQVTTATAVTGIIHLTTSAAAAAYVPIWGDGAYERRKDGRTQVLFPDAKWRPRIGAIVDGQPVETWGPPED